MNRADFDRIMRETGRAETTAVLTPRAMEEILADAARVRDCVEQFCLAAFCGASASQVAALSATLDGAPYSDLSRPKNLPTHQRRTRERVE